MTPAQSPRFRLLRPRCTKEAQDLLREHAGAVLLAGGQSLIPQWRSSATPEIVVALDHIDLLQGVELRGSGLFVASQTPLSEIASSALVQREFPTFALMVAAMGDRFMRARATLAGAICATNGIGCVPAAMLGSDAVVHTTDRLIPATEWFKANLGAESLQPSEIIVGASFPVPRRASHQCLRLTPARVALLTVFATHGQDGFRVGVSGVANRSLRWQPAESWLLDGQAPHELNKVFERVANHSGGLPLTRYLDAQAQRLLRRAGQALTY